MNWFFKRLTEPSTMAGIGLIVTSAAQAIASGGKDLTAVGTVVAGIGAIIKSEAAKKAE